MDVLTQLVAGLVLRALFHLLALSHTRLGAAVLGLAESALVHGALRQPRRSRRTTADAHETDAYVALVARLGADLLVDGVEAAAIVGLWAGLGIVLADVLGKSVYDAEPAPTSASRSSRSRSRSR
jgi:hypothetical protein